MFKIKFHAWNLNWKMMLEVLSIDFAGGLVFVQPLADNSGIEEIDLEDVDLLQYTGMNDYNGIEIYEGDICLDSNNDIIQIIRSNMHQWGCKIIKGDTLNRGLIFPLWQWDNYKENGYRTLKVIGNIHENSELLL